MPNCLFQTQSQRIHRCRQIGTLQALTQQQADLPGIA
jgi:hypothetical protein